MFCLGWWTSDSCGLSKGAHFNMSLSAVGTQTEALSPNSDPRAEASMSQNVYIPTLWVLAAEGTGVPAVSLILSLSETDHRDQADRMDTKDVYFSPLS